MKNDDFEKQLQQQPMQQVPGHWREEILASASSRRRLQTQVAVPAVQSWWRQLLWPCPQAWGALAAVWVVILFLNHAGSETEVTIAKVPTESRDVMVALKQQLQFRAELMSANDTPVAEPPKMSAPQSGLKPSMQTMAV